MGDISLSTRPSEGPYTAIVLNNATRLTPALIAAATTVAVPPTLMRSYFSRNSVERKSWLLILHHFPMPTLIWSNTANPAFLFQLLDYFLDAGTTQSKRIHHFLSGYSRFLPNHLQYFLPTFLPTFLLTPPRTLHPSFGRQRDDGAKGVSFNELGLGALGVQRQVLAYVQDTRPGSTDEPCPASRAQSR